MARWSRRSAAVGSAFLVAAALTGAGTADRTSLPAPAGPPAWAIEAAGRLSVQQQVGQLVVGGFDGLDAPRSITSALRTGNLSGVILFAGNVESPKQLRELTRSLQEAAGRGALVAVDQEGGLVRRIPFAAPRQGQPDHGSVAQVRRLARRAGGDLRSLGVNVNLAPVADVPASSRADISGRAFPGPAAEVARKVAAAVEGYKAAGVAPTPKHFPGLGAAPVNTDDASVVIRRSAAQLRRTDLVPFRSAVAARAPLIMVSHALYPGLDGRRIASQSKRILDDLLRGKMRYAGAIVTDALEASAVLERSSIAVAAERSLLAGCDLLLLTHAASHQAVVRRLAARARASRAVGLRVRQAAARVLVLKRALGLRLVEAAEQVPGDVGVEHVPLVLHE